MTGVVILDTNLLVLLIVGNTSKSLINSHKRLKDYSEDDFDVLSLLEPDPKASCARLGCMIPLSGAFDKGICHVDGRTSRDVQAGWRALSQ